MWFFPSEDIQLGEKKEAPEEKHKTLVPVDILGIFLRYFSGVIVSG